MANEWYKVEFYGRMPEGEEPTIPDDMRTLAAKLAEPFGFTVIDRMSLTEEAQVLTEAAASDRL